MQSTFDFPDHLPLHVRKIYNHKKISIWQESKEEAVAHERMLADAVQALDGH